MSITIEIPATLRRFAAQRESVAVDAVDLQGALRQLVQQHPAMSEHLFARDGSLRRIVNVFVNDTHIRQFGTGPQDVRPGDTIHLVPAFAGG